MLTKVLFTILVIVAVVLFVRYRTAARVPAQGRASEAPPAWYWRALPAVLLLAALGSAVLVFWLDWREEQRVFTVRVIDTRSGDVRSYLVRRGDVHGRRFTTVDGRTVTLADVERMELMEGEHSAQ